MACIYKHIRKDKNEVFYIGIGKTKKRAYSKSGRNYHWNNVIAVTDYDIEIIETDLDWKTACERETYWIKYYGRRDLNEGTLVNMTDGGEGTPNISYDIRLKTSIRQSKLMSDPSYNPMYGKSHTIESKMKMSKSKMGQLKGIKKSPEFSKNLSEKLKGRKFTEDHKSNLSKANKERNKLICPHCGKSSTHNMQRYHFDNCKVINKYENDVHSSCTRLGMVKVTDLNGVETVYNSTAEVSRKLNTDVHCVIHHSKNGTSYTKGKYKGYKFELLNK